MTKQFKLVDLKTTYQESKRGLKIEIKPLTKQAIKQGSKIVAYLPDHLAKGVAEGLVAKLNKDRTIKLPE